MSSLILRFCSSMRELFSNTSFFRHSFSWLNERWVHWALRTVREGLIDQSLQVTCMILWMLCMIMAVSIDTFDKPNETLPCFCRSSIWKSGAIPQKAVQVSNLVTYQFLLIMYQPLRTSGPFCLPLFQQPIVFQCCVVEPLSSRRMWHH